MGSDSDYEPTEDQPGGEPQLDEEDEDALHEAHQSDDEELPVEEFNSDTEDDEPYEPGQRLGSPVKGVSRKDIAKMERQRLKDLAQKKKDHLDKLHNEQIKEAEASDTDPKARRLKYLFAQTEIFSHFMKGGPEEKKGKKAGSKRQGRLQERDEDKELMESNADDKVTLVNTRLMAQPTCIQGKMREYQLQGLNFLIRLYENGVNGILADEMGLGKTLQTISLLGYLHEYRGISGPHLVAVPKSTLGNWCNEIRRWCPSLRAFKFHGNKEERLRMREEEMVPGKWDICVTSFEMIITEKALLKKFHWRYIIIDEAHRIKNENSRLSVVLRTLKCNNRLLITGTPLQNNLHELWALLNFLVPELFHDSEQFDDWFRMDGDNDQQEVVQQLHKVLRPFLLRRLKKEVEKGLPPKKEIILKVGLTEMQKKYYRMLLQKDLDAINGTGERSRLLNVVMQLRKCCNHPYLFQGAEPEPFCNGEHLIDNAGKLVMLDKLLPRLQERGSRVLIFSQMTRLLDILEDYCLWRGHKYCRIDGNTMGDDRENMIDAFNAEGSEKFIFLLSTRAGGLGINLATADIVVLYDSDWNPQMDLQAMDRAHRIGQKKEVTVFRFMTEDSIEVKVIEKAYKKLALDALVIQQGRLADQNKNMTKEELQQMVRYGAEKIFNSSDLDQITDQDIDTLIAKGEEATKEMNNKMSKYTEQALQFQLSGEQTAQELAEFQEEDEEVVPGIDIKAMIATNWIDPPKRERKKNYSETEYYRKAFTLPGGSKSNGPRLPKMPTMQDYQFFDTVKIQELYDKEAEFLMYEYQRQQSLESGVVVPNLPAPDDPRAPKTLGETEIAERDRLLSEGFSNWSKRDFNNFVRGCERYGREDLDRITLEVEGKTEDEVAEYSAVFWERFAEIADHDRYIKNIEKGEAKIQRYNDIMEALTAKIERYKNPWRDLKISYGQNKGKGFTEEEDRFLICQVHKLGWGHWDELKSEIRKSYLFRFDWFFKSRTAQELQKRCDQLVRLVEKENDDLDDKPEQPKKQIRKVPSEAGVKRSGSAADLKPAKKGRA
uniref:Chromatin-remodeling complex ATPase n=2 Tax=Pyramimonas obovata TaxID=1411642 RepID=A0A7S0QUG6_9CHLO|mmetsp:Transcript_11441/g.23916  ORF Transcript_11441/g.23916 Transcript_11441/m.23916 type:complete len:1056 (+) Transcript_11441:180-3347(+)